MPPLDPTLRKLLENKVPDARRSAEEAARAMLNTLAVNRPEPFAALTLEQRQLRNALRAKARQLGNGSAVEGFEPLVEEVAYQQWHRIVFARFLAENHLLMHPSGVAVTLQDCAELAAEEGESNAWTLAARYASGMLPGIFAMEDPAGKLRFAPEGRVQLEALLANLPAPIFNAEDGLGWMYQFWQKNKKEAVNASERKIGGADLAPVTQLFTEDYMVRFLLENSLGAWWAARHPDSALITEWKYLRLTETGAPAAGAFAGWPERAAQVTLLDPCCGSGHILVAGFEMLARMRMAEEGLNAAQAGDAVLRDNLFGLELDPRCTQIAAFALALTAWKSGGYRSLPVPNVACSGIAVQGQLDTWLKLAGDDVRVQAGLERLYGLFKNAPDLGSLINPADLPPADRMFVADYEQVAPVLELALAKEHGGDDPVAEVFGAAAEGVAKAAKLLAGKYTLVVTNVPYLSGSKFSDILKKFIYESYPNSKADLATVFIERCIAFCSESGTFAQVSPQSWLYLGSYKKFRENLLRSSFWNFIAKLGPGAFETIGGHIVNISLTLISNSKPQTNSEMVAIDTTEETSPVAKADYLRTGKIQIFSQRNQLENPDFRIVFTESVGNKLLIKYADSYEGIGSGDLVRFTRKFWEIASISKDWNKLRSTTKSIATYSGAEHIIYWQNGEGDLYNLAEELKERLKNTWQRGSQAWGKMGVAINRMNDLYAELYFGEIFDSNIAAIIPKNPNHLNAIWHFFKSEEYKREVRKVDQALKVTNVTLLKVPFDLEHWQKIAEQAGPLPEPHSDDPTQWLFNGQPRNATEPLQVAAARLLGYHWPQQQPDGLDGLTDEDGMVCLPAVAGERPLGERLREVLAAAYDSDWSPRLQAELLAAAGAPGKSLEDWLRDDFFGRHCRLFQSRPFLWQIWDGRKEDGFSVLVNYHKLTPGGLDKLIYTYLGDWIRFQRARRDHGEPGAEGRLVAALELEKKLKWIKEGEPPYDIYVRWKPLTEQPLGWDPDLNDGVHLNIRPFVTAGVLRARFTINWNKDRGKNPDGSERLNDLHYSLAEKIEARKQKTKSGV